MNSAVPLDAVSARKYAPYTHDKLKAFIEVVTARNDSDDDGSTALVGVDDLYPKKSASVFSFTMPKVRDELKQVLPDLNEAQILASMTKYGDATNSATLKGPWFRLVQEVEMPWVCSIQAYKYPPSINGSIISYEGKASKFLAMINGCTLKVDWTTIKHSSWAGNFNHQGDPVVVSAHVEGYIPPYTGNSGTFHTHVELLVGLSTVKGKLSSKVPMTVIENAHFTYEPSINPISEED